MRFLIGFDGLRARLAPHRYPNIEIPDEGCLWFNINTLIGTSEIIAIPFELGGLLAPSLLISFPREAKLVDKDFLNKLQQIKNKFNDVTLFAATFTASERLMKFYN